jgi:hypothetical protein
LELTEISCTYCPSGSLKPLVELRVPKKLQGTDSTSENVVDRWQAASWFFPHHYLHICTHTPVYNYVYLYHHTIMCIK